MSWEQLDLPLKGVKDAMSRASTDKLDKKNVRSSAERRAERQTAVAEVFRSRWSNLWGALYREDNFPTSLAIRVTDARFLAILSRGHAGSREVAFGSGDDWIDALDALNTTVARDNWKDSKFQD